MTPRTTPLAFAKRALLLAALLAGAAQAQTLATSPNNAKGEIRLMAGRGDCPEGLRVVLSTTGTGEFIQGCWMLMEEKVMVTYSDGSRRLYSLGGFTLVPQKAAPTKQKGEAL